MKPFFKKNFLIPLAARDPRPHLMVNVAAVECGLRRKSAQGIREAFESKKRDVKQTISRSLETHFCRYKNISDAPLIDHTFTHQSINQSPSSTAIMPESEVKKHRCMPAAEIAAKVARLLDEAQVPNVLWGFLALGLVGKYEQLEVSEFPFSSFRYPS